MNSTAKQSAGYVVFLLFLAYAFSFIDRQILAILFEPIKAELALSDTQLGFLGGLAFALTYSLLGIPLAMLADRRGRKVIIATSLAIFSGMTALCGLATNFTYLALARVGVGVGEAGVNPASQSIIADLYPIEKRSTPMSIVATGAPVGMMAGLIGGGLIAGAFGWRTAFFVVGLPGLILAVVVWLTLREPVRGKADQRQGTLQEAPTFPAVLSFLWRTRAVRYLLLGTTLASIPGYGVIAWFPAFFMRTHDLTITQVGLVVGIVGGLCGVIGALLGGFVFDRVAARRSNAHALKVIGWVFIVAYPFSVALFLADQFMVAVALLLIPSMASSFYLGPTNALLQGLVQVRMRAVATSVSMLAANLIGLGLGPQVVGILSDLLQPTMGNEGLAYALISVNLISCLAAFMFFQTSTYVGADLQKATENETPPEKELTNDSPS